MQRGLAPLTFVILLTAGCAQPGRVDTADQVATARPTPSRFVAACADPHAAPAPIGGAAPTAATAMPDPSDPGEQFRLNHEANKAFRQRRALPPQVLAAAQPCVAKIRAGLDLLRQEGRFDGASIERVLTDAGLIEVESRKPGRLDTAGGGGLLFCGNSGFGYIFGEHGPPGTTVEAGGGIADGGCLPAPD